jgi:hypothetical protein
MLRRQREQHEQIATESSRAFDDFHEWVLSMPWVVERRYGVGTPGVRAFGVECEPLGRRRLWLLTGLQLGSERRGLGLAVIVPTCAADEIEAARWGRCLAPMPGDHQMVTVSGDPRGRRRDVEALVLTAYGCAMS